MHRPAVGIHKRVIKIRVYKSKTNGCRILKIPPLKDLDRKKGQQDPISLNCNQKGSKGKQDTERNKKKCEGKINSSKCTYNTKLSRIFHLRNVIITTPSQCIELH